jgi:hypothetical protein
MRIDFLIFFNSGLHGNFYTLVSTAVGPPVTVLVYLMQLAADVTVAVVDGAIFKMRDCPLSSTVSKYSCGPLFCVTGVAAIDKPEKQLKKRPAKIKHKIFLNINLSLYKFQKTFPAYDIR